MSERAVQDGQVSRLIRNYTEDFIIQREEDIIAKLLRHYRADTLTNDMLRGGIGEIAGLRGFRTLIESNILRGDAALEASQGDK